jgi:hypothetical protein
LRIILLLELVTSVLDSFLKTVHLFYQIATISHIVDLGRVSITAAVIMI